MPLKVTVLLSGAVARIQLLACILQVIAHRTASKLCSLNPLACAEEISLRFLYKRCCLLIREVSLELRVYFRIGE